MAIKKSFVPIMEHLNENLNKKVSDVIEAITAMASTKTGGKKGGTSGASTFLKDVAGNTVAIFDYYFKRWMPLVGEQAVEFGAKASAASGYSSMSKEGTSLWTKQQAEAKKAMSQILVDVESGNLEIAEIAAKKEEIEATRKKIAETNLGFATLEEVKEYLAEYCELPEEADSTTTE